MNQFLERRAAQMRLDNFPKNISRFAAALASKWTDTSETGPVKARLRDLIERRAADQAIARALASPWPRPHRFVSHWRFRGKIPGVPPLRALPATKTLRDSADTGSATQ